MLSEDEIKQIFFYVNDKDPNGCYADNVNVTDFAKKIELVVKEKIANAVESYDKTAAKIIRKM